MPVLWAREGELPDAIVNATAYGENVADFSGSGDLEEAHHHLFAVTPEVSVVHLAYTLLSVFTVIFGMLSAFIKEKMYAGEAIIATCVGIGFGPHGANIFSPTTWSSGNHVDSITLEVSRVVIALSVFAVGVELPKAYVWKHWRSLAFLLGPVMVVGWMVSGAFIYLCIPKLNFLDALVIAAAVTPTDPILAASVVGKGKFAQDHVPSHIRHILQAESGCNDGAAFPFLYLALFLTTRESTTVGHTVGWWVALVILYQIILGTAIGAAVGTLARKGMKFAKYHDLIDRESMVAMYVALALLVTGATTLAGSDDLLAAFACGTAFAWDDWFSESIEDSNFSSILDLIVNCSIFFYIGATIPFEAWGDANTSVQPWRLVCLGLAILFLRRIPTIFTFRKLLPDCRTKREALFMGHFGPMGVGALFISTLARERLPTPTYPPEDHLDVLSLVIMPITYFIILISILVHGLSIPIFTSSRRLQRRVSSFQRTYTAGSQAEPGWLSKVRRAGEPERSSSKDDDEKVEQTPSPSGSAEAEQADVMGSHNQGVAIEDGHPERITRWKEGGRTIVEDSEGEVVDVDNQGSAQTAPKVIDLEAQAPPKGSKRKQQAEEALDGAEEDEDSDHQRYHWWKRDAKTGKPRELTPDERRQARRDRAVRRERHYCTGNQPVKWREGNRIIVEGADGETIAVQEVGDGGDRDQAQITGEFPKVHRVTGKEHHLLSRLLEGGSSGADKGKNTLEKTFSAIEDGRQPATESSTSLQRPKPTHQSTGIRAFFTRRSPGQTKGISTADIKRTDHAEPMSSSQPSQQQLASDLSQEQPEASTSASEPAAEEKGGVDDENKQQPDSHSSNDDKDVQDRNLRFNVPGDKQLKRYDLED